MDEKEEELRRAEYVQDNKVSVASVVGDLRALALEVGCDWTEILSVQLYRQNNTIIAHLHEFLSGIRVTPPEDGDKWKS